MDIFEFIDSKELEIQLAAQIAAQLEIGIQKNGEAHLLVSGGTSPIGMFHLLSLKKIDWQKVTIGLVDERFISTENVASNERLVKENLLLNEAEKANFISMIYALEDEKQNLEISNAHYKLFHQNIDACVLGMGEDGHTASLFPKDSASEKNLISEEIGLVSTLAPHEPKHRISCSKAFILKSDAIYIMMIGETKKAVLQQASTQKLPIDSIISAVNKKVNIYYSEKK
jgi:6-phosphogluconolactonase